MPLDVQIAAFIMSFIAGWGMVVAVKRILHSKWWIDDEPEIKYSPWETPDCPKCRRPAEFCGCNLYGDDSTDEWMRK